MMAHWEFAFTELSTPSRLALFEKAGRHRWTREIVCALQVRMEVHALQRRVPFLPSSLAAGALRQHGEQDACDTVDR